jgi:hypothetical protein
MTTLARLQTEIRITLQRLMAEQPLDPPGDRAIAAMASIYPALRRLNDEAGFAWLAAKAARQALLGERMKLDPAALLPDMMRTDRKLRVLAYAGDLAALEWAMQAAWTTPKTPRLDVAQLALIATEDLPALQLRRQIGWSLVASPYPLLEIWRACHEADGMQTALGFGGEPTRLLVGRAWSEVIWLRLTCKQLQLLRQLEAGQPLGVATSTIRPVEASSLFDFLAGLVDRGVFTAVEQPCRAPMPVATFMAPASRSYAAVLASAPVPLPA